MKVVSRQDGLDLFQFWISITMHWSGGKAACEIQSFARCVLPGQEVAIGKRLSHGKHTKQISASTLQFIFRLV
jgi:hypothetical protein